MGKAAPENLRKLPADRGVVMTFVSKTDRRELDQELTPFDPLTMGETSFGEVFAASVGHVFDEELSISSGLNMELYAQRDEEAKQMVNGGFDLTPYTNDTGEIDYERLRLDSGNPNIKTNREIFDERNNMLAQRRAYALDVQERGSGMAQFLGSMTGYMLDPVNVMTMPLGASAASLRGLSTLARVGRVARTEAAIGAGAEIAIQPLVWAHKNEIGSPYEIPDAISAIATAAIGGAALGSAATGIAGFTRSLLDLPYPDSTPVAGARKELGRLVENLESNPDRGMTSEVLGRSARRYFQMDNDELTQQIILMRRADLDAEGEIALEAAEAVLESRKRRWGVKVEAERQDAIKQEIDALRLEEETRLTRGERKALMKQADSLRQQRNAVVEAEPNVVRERGVSARKAKAEAKERVRVEADAERARLQREIDEIEGRLEASRVGERARSDLSRVQQGVFPERLQSRLNQIEHQRMVEIDADYLKRLEETRIKQQEILPSVEADEVATVEPARTADDLDPYQSEIDEAIAALPDDAIIRGDGDVTLNAKEFIAEQDNMIDILNETKVCALA